MSVSVMAQTGVLTQLLPGAQVRAFGPLLHHEEALALQVKPIRRLLALGHIDGSSLRLSKGQQREIALLQRLISGTENPAESRICTALQPRGMLSCCVLHCLKCPHCP